MDNIRLEDTGNDLKETNLKMEFILIKSLDISNILGNLYPYLIYIIVISQYLYQFNNKKISIDFKMIYNVLK